MLAEIVLVNFVPVFCHVCHGETMCGVRAHLGNQRFSYLTCMATDIETLHLQKTGQYIEMVEYDVLFQQLHFELSEKFYSLYVSPEYAYLKLTGWLLHDCIFHMWMGLHALCSGVFSNHLDGVHDNCLSYMDILLSSFCSAYLLFHALILHVFSNHESDWLCNCTNYIDVVITYIVFEYLKYIAALFAFLYHIYHTLTSQWGEIWPYVLWPQRILLK